jgi:hypothetical protein
MKLGDDIIETVHRKGYIWGGAAAGSGEVESVLVELRPAAG